MKDVFGSALLDYQLGRYTEDIVTSTSISVKDLLPLPYLFRNLKEMPVLEQEALSLCRGRILDVGCGAGSHSLELKKKGLEVISIDISEGAIKTCKLRGLDKAYVNDIHEMSGEFDTILMLMNGSGLLGNLKTLENSLVHLKSILSPSGQVLIDSSDIKYMYQQQNGDYIMESSDNYYGELDFHIYYKGESQSFPWMYLDFGRLKKACIAVGLSCQMIKKGPHYDYLAKLSCTK